MENGAELAFIDRDCLKLIQTVEEILKKLLHCTYLHCTELHITELYPIVLYLVCIVMIGGMYGEI